MKLAHSLCTVCRGRGRASRALPRTRLGLDICLEGKIVPGVWRPLQNLAPGPVANMMLLTDGEIMAHAGAATLGLPLVTSGWYRMTPTTASGVMQDDYYYQGTWSAAASMNVARNAFASNVLTNGNLFVLGGEYSSSTDSGADGESTSTGEIYDPAANTWTMTAPFPVTDFGDHPTALLPTGDVLAGSVTTGTYVYRAASGTWTRTGDKLHGDKSDEESFVSLSGGGVLTYELNSGGTTILAQRYVAANGTWSDASDASGSVPPIENTANQEIGGPIRLPDGSILWPGSNGSTAIYSESSNTWTAGPTMPADPSDGPLTDPDAPSAILPNGRVMFAASAIADQFGTPVQRAHLCEFIPATSTTQATIVELTNLPADLQNVLGNEYCGAVSLLPLPNGHILLSTSVSSQVWDYFESDPPTQTIPVPTITGVATDTDPSALVGTDSPPVVCTLTGTLLTGNSEGASYGDDEEMSANFPIVKLTSTNRTVRYAKTYNWTPGVGDTAERSVQFELPDGFTQGQFSVQVIASGVASATFTPPAPKFADRDWAGYANGFAVPQGIIGTDCFANVQDATNAAPAGGSVFVFGADGVNPASGDFHEDVALNKPVALSFLRGAASFDSLAGADAGAAIVLHGANLTVGGDAQDTAYNGLATGAGELIKVGGGTMTLNGTANVSGGTVVNGGTSLVNGSVAGPGGVTVNNAGSTVRLGTATALALTTVTVNTNNGLDTNGFTSPYLGGLAGTGAVSLGTTVQPITLNVGTDGETTSYSGTLSGSGPLMVAGGGTPTIAGTSTTTAGTTVRSGTVEVTGTLNVPDPAVLTVSAAGTLRGDGVGTTNTVNASTVNVAGVVAAGSGTGPGKLTVASNSFTLSAGGIAGSLSVRLNGTAPGTGYDQLVVPSGSLNLAGAALDLVLGPNYIHTPGVQFDIIQNASSPTTGTFANLPDLAGGAVLSAGGQYFTISYHGGASGNDVVLTAISTPLAGVQVNDRSIQRSEVTSITVSFTSPVTFLGDARGAFKLLHLTDNVYVSLSVFPGAAPTSAAKLTFFGSETDPESELHDVFGTRGFSLADGRYRLTTGDYTSPDDTPGGNGLHLYRLFGDGNGDGMVDSSDFTLFQAAFNSHVGAGNYQWYFDADDDGWIFNVDLRQFGLRNGTTVF